MINQKLVDKFESNVDYTTTLNNFEGPLDLLLFLIKEAQIEVTDIFISEVTEQFLKYLQHIPNLDIGKASEYLAIAATIMEIKSRKLLPEPVDFVLEEDPEYLLKMQLEEYKLYKEASEKLKAHEDVNKFYKSPDKNVGDVKIVYNDFNLDGLVKAFSDLLLKIDQREAAGLMQKEIPKEVFTVSDKILFIKLRVIEVEKIEFDELFTVYSTKNEVVTTFQALLELLKMQEIKVEQNSTYDKIYILQKTERGEEYE